MLNTKEKKWFHWAFIAGAVLKAIDAFIELIGGILIFLINKALVVTIVLELTREELLEDPKDLIANYLVASAHTLTVDTQYFIALYLIVHGIIKIILSISLLKKKYWAYPAAIFVFALFVVYQIFRWSISGSILVCNSEHPRYHIHIFDMVLSTKTYDLRRSPSPHNLKIGYLSHMNKFFKKRKKMYTKVQLLMNPKLQPLITAKNLVVDSLTGKPTLVGIFDTIFIPKGLESFVDSFYVFGKLLLNSTGIVESQVKIALNDSKGDEIKTITLDGKSIDASKPININGLFPLITFKTEGKYSIKASVNMNGGDFVPVGEEVNFWVQKIVE